MAESQENEKNLPPTGEKHLEESDNHQEQSFSEHYFDDDADSQDLDIETTYLKRLRQQRKRIEDLSLHLNITREKYEAESAKVAELEMQLQKVHSEKVSNVRYEEVIMQFDYVQEENEALKETVQNLKRELFEITNENAAKIQKMASEYSSQRKRDQSKISTLQEKLSESQESMEKLQRILKGKQKEISEINSSYQSRLTTLKETYEEKIIIQQKRLEKSQFNNKTQQLEDNLSFVLRENEKLKEENFKLRKALELREKQLGNEMERYKSKISSLKKELKSMEKQHEEVKSSFIKIQKEKKDHTVEKEDLKAQTFRLKEELQSTILKKENDFYIEKRNLKMTIDQHTKTIEDLFKIKQELLARIKHLQSVLQRKEKMEKQRKSLLKDEMKEIDKLEKVIDKIVQ